MCMTMSTVVITWISCLISTLLWKAKKVHLLISNFIPRAGFIGLRMHSLLQLEQIQRFIFSVWLILKSLPFFPGIPVGFDNQPVSFAFPMLLICNDYSETITDLQAHPQDDRHILSTSKDGTVRLWDVEEEKCLAIYDVEATVSVSLDACYNYQQ